MTDVTTSDGVRLYAEATGTAFGLPVLFIHEFAADHRAWSRQVDALSGTFRCVTYASRGYPPSDVPPEQERYNYLRQADDAIDVLDAFGIARAHVVGLSMGGFCALQLGIRYPDRVLRCWWRARAAAPAPVAEPPSSPRPSRWRPPCAPTAWRPSAPGRPWGRTGYSCGARTAAAGKSSPGSLPGTAPKAWPSPSSGSSGPGRPCSTSPTSWQASPRRRSWSTATRTRPASRQGCCSSARSRWLGWLWCRTRGTHSTWRSPSCSMT